MEQFTHLPRKLEVEYDEKAIVDCLTDKFNDTDLRTICLDSDFKEVFNNFTDGQTLTDRAMALVTYASKQDKIHKLLNLMGAKNPNGYINHFGKIIKLKKKEPITSRAASLAAKTQINLVPQTSLRISEMRWDAEQLALHLDLFDKIEKLRSNLRSFTDELKSEHDRIITLKGKWGDDNITLSNLMNKIIPNAKLPNNEAKKFKGSLEKYSEKIRSENRQTLTKQATNLEAARVRLEESTAALFRDCQDWTLEVTPNTLVRTKAQFVNLHAAVFQDGMVDISNEIHTDLYNSIKDLVEDLDRLAREIDIDKEKEK